MIFIYVIKLVDILAEGKNIGNLYHSTSGENLISILKSNTLKVGQEANYAMTFTDRLSFTRDENFRPGDYTIEVDGNKLSNNYKITPFAYDYTERGQAEEVVKQSINDFSKYIVNIYTNIEAVENNPFKELEQIMKLYPGLKFTVGGDLDGQGGKAVREVPKQEALTHIKYNKY